MLKNLIAISRCLCLVGITALPSASRAQTANSAADYWPMQTGNTWTLLLKVGPDQTIKQVVTVTNVAKADDGSVATINYVSNGKTIQIEKYKITAAQIVRLEAGPNGSFKATPPVPIIKFPLTAGKTWTYTGVAKSGGQTASIAAVFTVSGPTRVSTQAGSFQAIRVHSALTITSQGQKIQLPNDYWFAPRVGLVKQLLTINGTVLEGNALSYKLK